MTRRTAKTPGVRQTPAPPAGNPGRFRGVLPYLAVGALAIGLRLWSVLSLASDLRLRDPLLDGRYYLDLASRLAHGEGWPAGPSFMTPLYPLIVSFVFRLLPPEPVSVAVAQSILGLFSLWLLFGAACRDLGRPAAWALAGLYLLCGPILAMESEVLTESLLLFLVAAALRLWPSVDDASADDTTGRKELARAFFFGLVGGLLSIGRGVFLLLPAAAAIQLAWQAGRPRPGPTASLETRARRQGAGGSPPAAAECATNAGRRAFSGVAAIVLGTAMALAPFVLRQSRAAGRLELSTLNGGLNLYIGWNARATGLYGAPEEIDLEQDLTATRSASLLAGRKLTLEESSRFWTNRALGFIRANPGRAVTLLGRKALYYLSPREVPQIEDFQMLREAHASLRVAFINFGWILPLAVFGAASALADRRRVRLSPWLLIIGLGWVSALAFFVTGRYRLPVLAGFLGPAALGVNGILEQARNRRLRPAILILPVVVVLQLVLPGYPAAKARAFDAYQEGVRLGRAGNLDAALAAEQSSAALWPAQGECWHERGVILVQLGRLDEAARSYEKALEALPNSAVTHYNLGAVRYRMGAYEPAVAEFREAARLDPLDPQIESDLAVALVRSGQPEEAANALRRALELDPTNQGARRNLQALEAVPARGGSH